MFIVRCDAEGCRTEVVADQPNFYALDPHGWYASASKTSTGRHRRGPPHACSEPCALKLEQAGQTLIRIDRAAYMASVEAAGIKPKGSANCKVCTRVGTGKRCLYHGLKPRGWPLVTTDGSHEQGAK